MPKDVSALVTITEKAKAKDDAGERLRIEADAWVAKQLEKFESELDQAVIAALDEDHSVAAVARAYTISGKTPNRNAIYTIKAKYANLSTRNNTLYGDYPFEWKERRVNTAQGERILYDVHADLSEFGPDAWTGEYTWRFDEPTGTLEPMLTDIEPYPIGTKYYKQVLDRWLSITPYPGVLA